MTKYRKRGTEKDVEGLAYKTMDIVPTTDIVIDIDDTVPGRKSLLSSKGFRKE